jgi:hypothetical protein
MTEIEPLRSSQPGSRLGAMLRAAAADEPPARLRQRILTGLGVGVGVAVTSATAVASASVVGSTVAGKASASPALGLLLLKWLALGTLGGLTAAVGLDAAFSPRAAEPTSRAPERLVDAAPRVSYAPPPLGQPVESTPAAPATEAVAQASTRAPSVAPSSASRSAALREELLLVDAARAALAGGRPDEALRRIAEYERLPTTGALVREARVLRIEALVMSGNLELARVQAEQYSVAFPNDAHARRLRALSNPSERGSTGTFDDMNRVER